MSFYSGKNNSNSADINSLTTQVASNTSSLADSMHVITIESFSGTTDTEKLQNAASSISATGGTIKLKNKTYTMDNIVLPSGVNVIGSGNTVLQPSVSGKNYIFLVQSNSVVRDLTIKDNGLYLKAGVQVGDYDYQGRGSISNATVENIVINLTTANSGGIKIGYGSNINIHSNIITDSLTGDYGIVVHSDNTDIVSNVFVSHNLVDGFTKGICCYGTAPRQFINVNNNTVKNCSIIGIDMYHGGMSSCINNVIYKCYKGIYGTTTTIDNNYGRGNIISGNQVHQCTEIGIYLEQMRNGKISDNTVQGCDIGIYGGSTMTYSLIDGNGLTFNRVGIMISNDYAPTPMLNYDNGDLKISNNFIAFNSQNAIELAGVRGSNVIENNEIRANNTVNGDYYGILLRNDVIASISRNRACENVIIKGNHISNNQNSSVNMATGYQKGIKNSAAMGTLTIVDNIMNNATTELSLTSLTLKFMKNIVNSALATPTTLTSVTTSTFGNIGLFEGELVATASQGISVNQGVANSASLPTADITQRGKIIRVNRSGGTNDDELYMCVYLSAGGYGWKKLTMS